MALSTGQSAPDFELPADDGTVFRLSSRRGRRTLIVFYPGDDTSVCTAQLCEYRDGMEAFQGLDNEQGIIRYRHVEALSVFRRSRDELIQAIQALGAQKA